MFQSYCITVATYGVFFLLDQLCSALLPITVQCFRNIGTYLLNNPPILTQALTDMLITSYILF